MSFWLYRFLPFRLLSLTCSAVVLPAPCAFRDNSIKQLVTALSQHYLLAERTKRHLATHCPCTCSWSVTELTQRNLTLCFSFCGRYQLVISAVSSDPFCSDVWNKHVKHAVLVLLVKQTFLWMFSCGVCVGGVN